MSFYRENTHGKRYTRGDKYRRDPENRYRYVIRYRDKAGREHKSREWLAGDLEAAAREMELRGIGSGRRLTWGEALGRWVDARSGSLSEAQLVEVERSVRFFVEFAGDIPIEETTREIFSNFQLERARKARGATANKHRRNLFSVAHWVERSGYVESLPFEKAPTVSTHDSRKVEAIDPGEVGLYLSAIRNPWARLPVEMIVLTGARSGAVCGLREEDLLGAEEMVLREKGRGGEKRREAYAIDGAILRVVSEALGMKADADRTSDYVFLNSRGTPWTSKTLGKRIGEAWEAAGLPHHRVHDLRHLFGDIAGESFEVDMIRAGMAHSSRATSERYAKGSRGREREKAERVRSHVRRRILEEMRGTA